MAAQTVWTWADLTAVQKENLTAVQMVVEMADLLVLQTALQKVGQLAGWSAHSWVDRTVHLWVVWSVSQWVHMTADLKVDQKVAQMAGYWAALKVGQSETQSVLQMAVPMVE